MRAIIFLLVLLTPSCGGFCGHAIAPPRNALLSARRPTSVAMALSDESADAEEVNADAVLDASGVDISAIAREEMASIATLDEAAQEEALPELVRKIEGRARSEGYQLGDAARAAVEATRGEVQRQLDAEWSMSDLALLLKIGLFLGAGAAAPVAGLAALPAAAVLGTYGAVLKAELGVRAMQEVVVRLAERASRGIADGVKDFTGKDEYHFGDLTETTVRRMGYKDYEFGDFSRGAVEGVVKSATGKNDYKFGQFTEGAVHAVTGNTEYKFGDFTKSLLKGRQEKNKKNKKGNKLGDFSRGMLRKLKGEE